MTRAATTLADAAYRAAALPPTDAHWRAVPYCVLDLETTGLDCRSDEIVSYAALPIDDGRIRPGEICAGLVKPAKAMAATSICIHGIRPDDLCDAPALEQTLDELLGALTGRVLVVHVDWVERGFLTAALRMRGYGLREPILDTARLARALDPTLPEMVALSGLARRLGLPVHRQHTAAGDALTTAQVLLSLVSSLEAARGPQTLATLEALGSSGAGRRGLRELLRR